MEGLFFYLFATLATIAALLTITRREAVTSAFWLIFCFLNIAALFATLSAHFMAVLQVLVYAGAIMVFFLFVTMFLGKPTAIRGGGGLLPPAVAFVTVLALAVMVLRMVGQPVTTVVELPAGYGGVQQVSELLLTEYIFAFEVTGVLLLVAVIGAVFLARKVMAPARSRGVEQSGLTEGGQGSNA